MLIFNHITKRLDSKTLSINLSLPTTDITAIFGASGAGKSTLLNIISGLIHADNGSLQFNNKCLFDYASQKSFSLPPQKRKIGYVFQESLLFPHLTVKNNLYYGMNKKEKNTQFEKIVHLLDIESLLSRYPKSLSGGEKQRVAIGRALLSKPDLVLMDEPLSSLDSERKQEIINYINALSNNMKTPILYVTHSVDEVLQLAKHVIFIPHSGEAELLTLDAFQKIR